MKIFTKHSYLELDLYDLINAFSAHTVLDENKPFVYFDYIIDDINVTLNFKVEFEDKTIEKQCVDVIPKYYNLIEQKRYIKRCVKKHFYLLLSEYYKKELPWGSLTGIRPTRVAYDFLEKGLDKCFIKEELQKQCCVSWEKARIVDKVIKNQVGIIKNDNLIDLYINIPFCPSKCSYCSFISAEYSAVEKLIPTYIETLIKEINAVKGIIRDKAYIVKTIYIGGGTPTVLNADQLELLLQNLAFDVSEFTVECGRPDTITKEKLDVLKKYGVTRISINPQTFVDATLKRIGRKHTVKDVIEAYKLAIDYNFIINMDLIAGLPGESLRGFKKTIQTVLELYPDNITIHTLALKKGSELINDKNFTENETTDKMVQYGMEQLQENGYKPYYMYKLKNQNVGLENIGYYRTKQCMFNIDSMEETASIIACGANAISKKIFFIENRIERQANPKFATDYIQRIEEMIKNKQKLF